MTLCALCPLWRIGWSGLLCGGVLELGRAEGAAGGFVGDDGAAEGAFFFGGLLGRFFVFAEALVKFLVEFVQQADEHEHHYGHEHEGQDVVRERAVIYRYRGGFLRLFERRAGGELRLAFLEHDKRVLEIRSAQEQAQGRHNDVVDE